MARRVPGIREGATPYGSLTLFEQRRVGPGSTIITDDVDTQQDDVKTWNFRSDPTGSWHIDVAYGPSGTWMKLADGTTPDGFGTVRGATFQEPYARTRARFSMSQEGTVTITYGRIGAFKPER